MTKSLDRRVKHGSHFSQTLSRRLLRETPLCPKCRREKPTVADHIVPLAWSGAFHIHWSKRSQPSNCGVLCEKCHDKKSRAEVMIDAWPRDERDAARIEHVKAWRAVHFTPKGNRRTVKVPGRDHDNSKSARQVHKAKANARLLFAALNSREKDVARLSGEMYKDALQYLPQASQAKVEKYKRQHRRAARVRREKGKF